MPLLHNEFSWESRDYVGGNSDDMDRGKCMVWVDTELDTKLYGGKNDVMEYGDKCWSVQLDNELSLLSNRELAAGKSEKMVEIPSSLPGRDMWASAIPSNNFVIEKGKNGKFNVTKTGREVPTNGLHNTEGRVVSYK